MNPTYLRYELIRAVRNKRGFIISLLFPLIFFFLIAGGNRQGMRNSAAYRSRPTTSQAWRRSERWAR